MAWLQYVLRWPDEAAWRAAASDADLAAVVEVGRINAELPADAPEGTLPEALPGWHVVIVPDAALPDTWAAAALDTPPSGAPLFADIPVYPPVPETVTRFQARAALLIAGLLAPTEAAVAASGDAMLQLAWAEAVEFKRHSPSLLALGAAIGLTSADIDALFRQAAQINA